MLYIFLIGCIYTIEYKRDRKYINNKQQRHVVYTNVVRQCKKPTLGQAHLVFANAKSQR